MWAITRPSNGETKIYTRVKTIIEYLHIRRQRNLENTYILRGRPRLICFEIQTFRSPRFHLKRNILIHLLVQTVYINYYISVANNIITRHLPPAMQRARTLKINT